MEEGEGWGVVYDFETKIFFLPKTIYAKKKTNLERIDEELVWRNNKYFNFIIWMYDRNTMAIGRHP